MDSLLEAYRRSSEFTEARAALLAGGAVGGFWGAALPFFLAAAEPELGEAGSRIALVIAPSPEDAEELLDEIECFAPGRAILLPEWDDLFVEDAEPDADVFRERVAVLREIGRESRRRTFVIAPVQAVLQPVLDRAALAGARLELRRDAELPPGRLAETLVRRAYRNVPLVQAVGEFSWRGDILDLWPHSAEHPLRVEFFGDTVDSIREFRADSQRSVPGSETDLCELVLPLASEVFIEAYTGAETLVLDWLADGDRVLLQEPEEVLRRVERVYHNIQDERASDWRAAFVRRLESAAGARLTVLPPAEAAGPRVELRFGSVESYPKSDLEAVFDAVRGRLESGNRLCVYCENDGEAQRFRELVADHELEEGAELDVAVGTIRRGFAIGALDLDVLTTRELFNRRLIRRVRKRHSAGQEIQSFLELERGDFVVHLVHGIGRYLGIETFEKDGVEQEFLALRYRDEAKVYVPVSKIDLVQKYIGSGDKPPALDKIGGTAWARKKEAVESALRDMAAELLDVQSLRLARPGHAYPPDSEWQREFEAAFPFEDTPDQVEVTEAIKGDLVRARPMDRLICGDVGYGKTELAMRAAFKVVDGGRQVAVLVPTTLLAEQHFRTFGERMAEFPVSIEVLSRFRSKRQQREIVQRAAEGGVDILIGTHRLLSSDVRFRDLGMVVIDEEQRFGVQHKERLKRLRSQVEVLTLSATPIPRTLHMALLGIRDISSLTTPPEGRAAIQTEICHFDRKKVREIIVRELNRDGQIYFVHNRVHDIDIVRRDLEEIVPEARIVVGHGQMDEHDLEERMVKFLEREADVLLATTIIESGIDIPTANTILINEADRYGLADLHQLRGRVGRYKSQAYCYLLLPEHRHVHPDARKRLKSLVEFSGLGSGFQIAMRDLEIRGAGNILGKEQSGHIATVGYDLYCRLLDKCVKRLRDEEYREPVTVEVDLALEAHIPDGFVADHRSKISIYRQVSTAQTVEAVVDLRSELVDRYGKLPEQLDRLLDLHEARVRCSEHGVEFVGREEEHLVLRGTDAMKRLLDGCTRRVVVLDGRTVAVDLRDPRVPARARLSDGEVFRLVLAWLREGRFPERLPGRRRFVDISK